MEHARTAGFPVPEVRDVSGPDMTVARVRGRTMTDELGRRPWRMGAHARTLGDLHRRLHAIALRPACARRSAPATRSCISTFTRRTC